MKAVDINGKYHEVSLDELQWRPSVYGIVIKDGSILLSSQHTANQYDLPGGGIETHENIEQALVREIKEETGIDTDIGELMMATDNIFIWKPDDPSRREVLHSIMLYYVATMIGGEISTKGFDVQERECAKQAVWLPLDELKDVGIACSYDWREIIEKVTSFNRRGIVT